MNKEKVIELARKAGFGVVEEINGNYEIIERFATLVEAELHFDVEPVAWMNPRGGVLRHLVTGLERNTYTIPLYTHPAPDVVEGLVEALEGLVAIAHDSQGVAGYHLNGEIAEWDDFPEIYAAKAALAAVRDNTNDRP